MSARSLEETTYNERWTRPVVTGAVSEKSKEAIEGFMKSTSAMSDQEVLQVVPALCNQIASERFGKIPFQQTEKRSTWESSSSDDEEEEESGDVIEDVDGNEAEQVIANVIRNMQPPAKPEPSDIFKNIARDENSIWAPDPPEVVRLPDTPGQPVNRDVVILRRLKPSPPLVELKKQSHMQRANSEAPAQLKKNFGWWIPRSEVEEASPPLDEKKEFRPYTIKFAELPLSALQRKPVHEGWWESPFSQKVNETFFDEEEKL